MTASAITTESQDQLTAQPAAKKAAFGTVFTANMLSATYENGAWSDFTIRPVENFNLHPATLVLHYSQTIFEGMKAYSQADGSVALFRPEMNAARLNRSAKRMAIPPIDEAAFIAALAQYAAVESADVPARPGSLYLRPTIFAAEAAIGVRAANKYEFFVIAMPVESYFSGDATALEIFVSESVVRAAQGGTGDVKAGANYAITLKVIDDAKQLGSNQVLFLDALGHRLIEEAGGMNFVAVRGNRLITPPVSGTILAGVTRDSLLKLAPALGFEAVEEPIQIDELVADIKSGVVTEIFLCGTAAVIASIDRLRFENGETVSVGEGGKTPVADKIRDTLLDIQFGAGDDPFHWMVPAR
jgi:branched-chain amino acid aminotransferase